MERIIEIDLDSKYEYINKYDDNYIYNLINEYMESFNDKKTVKEIRNLWIH